MTTTLTDRQAQVLTFMVRHFESTSLWPTIRELSVLLYNKPRSTNAISEHFDRLERRGYVERVGGGKSRACRVVRLANGQRVVPRLVPVSDLPPLPPSNLDGQRGCS